MKSDRPKKVIALLLLHVICLFSSCGSFKNQNFPDVAISITIKTDNSYEFNSISFDWYKYKLLEQLQRFQRINLVLVEPEENPPIQLDLTIDNFNIWPKEQNRNNRTYSNRVQTGTDAKGNPVFQIVTANVEIIQTRLRSTARFAGNLKYNDPSIKGYKKTLSASYVWQNISIGNISGDSRAVDPSIYSATGTAMEPAEQDLLLQLINQDLLRLISNNIMGYYQKIKK